MKTENYSLIFYILKPYCICNETKTINCNLGADKRAASKSSVVLAFFKLFAAGKQQSDFVLCFTHGQP